MEYNIGTVVTLKKGEGRFLKSGGRIVMVPRKTFEKSVKKILQ